MPSFMKHFLCQEWTVWTPSSEVVIDEKPAHCLHGLDKSATGFGLLGVLSIATGPFPTPQGSKSMGLTSAGKKVENVAGTLQVESELGG